MHVPDRLSSLDKAFLTIESGPLHMHVGVVAVFEGGDLIGADGGLDFAPLRASIGRSIEAIPRFREHVRSFPLLGTVWSPDPHFRLDYHLRHTAIPKPGSLAQLHALAGRLFSQRLDRERPLWEMYFVEGLPGGRFAVITKAHHAMLDGVAGMGVLAALFSIGPTPMGEASRVHESAPLLDEPGTLAQVRALLEQRVRELPLFGARVGRLLAAEGRAQSKEVARGITRILGSALHPSPSTPLNPDTIGPHRSFDGTRLSLERLKEVKRTLGGTLNDVALTVVTGALRRHLIRRGADCAAVGELRALVPVNVRPKDAAAGTGNHVAMLLAHLPVGEPDVLIRFGRVRAHSEELKHGSHEVEAVALVEELSDLGPDGLIGLIFSTALRFLPFHVVVTNMPGPQLPLYLGPAQLTELYPMVPLFARQSVGMALVSYDGGLFVGVNADADSVPDLKALIEDLGHAEAELYERAFAPAGINPRETSR
jgi:diacylglycerol O-acyltransferase